MVPGVRVVLLAICLASLAPLLAGARAPHDVDVQIQLGDLLYASGRYRESLEAYQRADRLGEGPSRIRAKMGLIRSALRIAEFDLATEHARLLQKLAPDNDDATALRGDAAWAAGHFDEAEAMAKDVLGRLPGHARARLGLARSLAGRNQLQAAFGEAQAALASAPSDPEVHLLLGSLNQRLRRVPEAIASYTNYINLLPNKDRGTMAVWARSEIRLLQSYGNRIPLQIDPRSAGRVHEIPFRLDRGKVIVSGRANGRPVQFTVDTGAEHTVLTVKTAERVGVKPIVTTLSAGVGEVGLRGLQVGRLDSLEVGTFKVDNVRCMVKNPPLTGLPTAETEAFSPLALGLSAELDYAARTLKIGESIPVVPADVELPLRVNRLATIRGVVNDDRQTNFVVDTGGEVLSISTSTARTLLPPPRPIRIRLKVYGTSGWDTEAYLLPGVDLEFDEIRFQDASVVVLDLRAPSVLLGYQIGGIIGHTVLSKYRVAFDLERSVLRLKRL
ncbi:MAG: aspartyl protease family protein [Vicinamibacterales bacterium]